MTPRFLAGLCAAAPGEVGCVPQIAGSWEPLAAVYPRVMRPRLRAHLARGERALHRLIEAAVAAGELRPHLVAGVEVALFANWNTPSDCVE